MRANLCSLMVLVLVGCVSGSEQAERPSPAVEPAQVPPEEVQDRIDTWNADHTDDDLPRHEFRKLAYWRGADEVSATGTERVWKTPAGEFQLHTHRVGEKTVIVTVINGPEGVNINTFQDACREEKGAASCLFVDALTAGKDVVFIFARGAYMYDAESGITKYVRLNDRGMIYKTFVTPFGIVLAYATSGYSNMEFGGFHFYDGNQWSMFQALNASFLNPDGGLDLVGSGEDGKIYVRVDGHVLAFDIDDVTSGVGEAKITRDVPDSLIVSY